MGQVPAPRHRALGEKARRPSLPEAGCSRGPWGRGGGPSTAGATGRAPPLPVSSTNRPEQLCLRQGEAATLKNKNPKGGTSPVALEGRWAPTPSTGQPGPTARLLGGTTGHGPAATQGLVGCPVPVGGKPNLLGSSWGEGRKTASGSPCPHAPDLGSWTSGRKSMEAHYVVCTHPAFGRRSSQRSPHPGPPGTSA